ncbi:MAG: sigma 54-interacting transcriptional regulator [Phycisphaeraceae bacterium]|nr:sigma 54-interacting transcriptional regulator [Phycisphaeraceae bacterium]
MEAETPHPIDYKFVVDFLLEMAHEQSLDHLVQMLLRQHLTTTQSSVVAVVIWLIEKGDQRSGELTSPESGDQSFLYAVAGVANASADAPHQPQPSRFPDHLARISLGIGPIGRIASTRQPCLLHDLDRDPGELAAAADWFKAERIRGFVAVPLIHNDEVLGVLGSFDHANPPPNIQEFGRIVAVQVSAAIVIARSFEEIKRLKAQLERQNAYLREEVIEAKAFGELVGQSAALRQVGSQIDLVAPTEASVLILGETGTGKELVAYEIHRRSQRRDKAMVRVNCASVPKDLYESEFFGHAKGAFTGAIKDRAGRFETAEGGTLFLDEIAEVPLELQSKLLRILQEKRYERVGEDRTRRADVRIIAATNRDLKKEVEAGRFREDLYYRLNVFPIQVAPLRERKEDIPLLAQHFAYRSVKELRYPKARLTRAGIIRLQAYDWPGNVRELQNVIERAVILARGGALEFDLPVRDAPPTTRSSHLADDQMRDFLTETEMRQRERENILAVLEMTDWKIRGAGGAAELLGIKASTLQSRIKAIGLQRPK